MLTDLKNKRILVTRSEPQASGFVGQIERSGGVAVVTPLIQIACTRTEKIDAEKVELYEWLVFTSANGVRCFFEGLRSKRVNGVKIAVVGAKTNDALREYGYAADFIPTVYNAKTMAPEFIRVMNPLGPVLIVHGRLSGTTLNESFIKEKIPFHCLEVYDTPVNRAVKQKVQQLVETIDYITFTSPSTVDAFMELVDDPKRYFDKSVFTIGTTTEKRAREQGFKRVFVPNVFTVEGIMEQMKRHINDEGTGEHHDDHKV